MRAIRPLVAVSLVLVLCALAQTEAQAQTGEPPPLPPEPVEEPVAPPEAEPAPEPTPEAAPAAKPAWSDWEQDELKRREQDRTRERRDAADTVAEDYERHLGIGVSILKEHGFGGVARLQWAWFGLEASVAMSPYFIIVSGACSEFILEATWRISTSVLGTFGSGRFRHGPRLGFTYDGFFGPGGQLGYQIEIAFKPWIALSVGVGLLIFPLGSEPAENKAAAACNVNPSSIQLDPLLTVAQPYVGASLLFYLF